MLNGMLQGSILLFPMKLRLKKHGMGARGWDLGEPSLGFSIDGLSEGGGVLMGA